MAGTGFASRSMMVAVSTSRSRHVNAVSEVGNGTLSARGPAQELQYCGCLLAPDHLPQGSGGGARSPITHSSYLRLTVRILGKSRINRRLCVAGSFDPSEWEFPPKPKWMRWPTYQRAEEKFDRYEATLDVGTFALVAKFLGAG